MAFIKLNGGAGVMLVTFALLAATCRPALADTTTLVCSTGNSSDAGPTTIDLDEAKGTVTMHGGGVRLTNGTSIAGITTGPFPAKFTSDAIVFSEHNDVRDTTFTINRLTGMLARDLSQNGQQYHYEWTCQVAKAKF